MFLITKQPDFAILEWSGNDYQVQHDASNNFGASRGPQSSIRRNGYTCLYDDHAGGPFLVITQSRDDTGNGKVLIDFDEFDAIIDVVKLLKSGMDEEDFA